MSTISNSTNRVAGLMSGLDTEELVKAMTTNTKNRINTQKQKLQLLMWKQESYRSIISKISDFKNKFLKIESETSIKAAAVMKKYAAKVSNDKVISAVASPDAVPGTYTISQASSAKAAAFESGTPVSTGEIKLDFSKNVKNRQYFVDVELDGVTKKVEFRGGDGADGIETAGQNFVDAVNEAFKDLLGEGQSFKIRNDENGNSYLSFEDTNNSDVRHSVCVGAQISAVGLSSTAYSNTTKSSTLGSITFKNGLQSSDGKYKININGIDFEFNDNTTIDEMISTINNSKAGAVLSFSSVSQTFTLESKETGTNAKLNIYQSHGNLLNAMFNWDDDVCVPSDPDSAEIKMEKLQATAMKMGKTFDALRAGYVEPEDGEEDDGTFLINIKFKGPGDSEEVELTLDLRSYLSRDDLEEGETWSDEDIVDALNKAFVKAHGQYHDDDGNDIDFFEYQLDGNNGYLMLNQSDYGIRFDEDDKVFEGLTNYKEYTATKNDVVSDSAYMIFDVDGQKVLVKAADGEKITINDLVNSGLFEYSNGVLTPVNGVTITSTHEEVIIGSSIIDKIIDDLVKDNEYPDGLTQEELAEEIQKARDAVKQKATNMAFDAMEASAPFMEKYFDKYEIKGAVYGDTQTAQGENATLTVSNDGGKSFTKYTSANGSFTFDGVTINVNEMQDFEAATDDDYITVEVTKDNEAVLDVIKQFVEDYNTLLDELYEEIGTSRPKSKGSYYDPLTEEQEEEMDEKEIEKWNENAKVGLIYRDTNVQRFLSELRGVMTTRIDGFGLANLGIMVTTSWEDHGKIEIKNENALIEAIEMNGDKIADFFTGTNGFAAKIDSVFDKAISTTTGHYGYLAALAGIEGTKTVDDNQMFKQMEYIQNLIDRLTEKYENEQERYWSKYTRLEKYMAQAQSQMSYFTDMGASY